MAKQKLIWFPFYPTDFLSSSKVALMDSCEVGAYVLLLCHAWGSEDCSVPSEDDKLRRLARFSGDLTLVKSCFQEQNGRLYNERLKTEWEKGNKLKEIGSINGRQGANARWPQRVTGRDLSNRSATGTCLKPVTGSEQVGNRYPNRSVTGTLTGSVTGTPTGLEHSSPSPSQSPSEEEKKDKDKDKKELSVNARVAVDDEGGDPFDQFWKAYPRKVGKQDARKTWLKMKDRPPLSRIFEALALAKQSEQWKRSGGQFIPHPATWLNQGRWDDEPIEVSGMSDPSGMMAGFAAFLKQGEV